jgi:hypothetical protein
MTADSSLSAGNYCALRLNPEWDIPNTLRRSLSQYCKIVSPLRDVLSHPSKKNHLESFKHSWL